MDLFDVIISPKALSQLSNYIDYLQYTLLNEKAARNVWLDALETQEQLSRVADSLKLCTYPQLKKEGYRIIPFLRHRYLMLYRIDGTTVYVDAIYHQLRSALINAVSVSATLLTTEAAVADIKEAAAPASQGEDMDY